MNNLQFNDLSRDNKESYLYDNYNDSEYEIEDALFDMDNGSFELSTIEEYSHYEIVRASITNGQHSQARDQCLQYDLHYDLIKKGLDNEK